VEQRKNSVADMKTYLIFIPLLLCSILYSCNGKPAGNAQGATPDNNNRAENIPYSGPIKQLAEAAKNGDGGALDSLWDALFYHNSFNANNSGLVFYDAQLCYEVYKMAKAKNPALVIDSEATRLATIQRCAEAGNLDVPALINKYHIQLDTMRGYAEIFPTWEIAREVSYGREFGQPDPLLILQLVCQGGSELVNLDPAVDVTYNNWKANKVDTFEPANYVTDQVQNDYRTMGYLSGVENDADYNWRVKTVAPQLKNKAGEQLEPAVSKADKFFYAKAEGEEGLGGSGIGLWIKGSEEDQRNAYLDLIVRTNRDSLPVPFSGDNSSDDRLNKTYKAVLDYLHKHPADEGMNVSDDGVRAAQRLWIPYRDATAKLLHTIRPDVEEGKWKNWLTEVRIAQLNDAVDIAKGIK